MGRHHKSIVRGLWFSLNNLAGLVKRSYHNEDLCHVLLRGVRPSKSWEVGLLQATDEISQGKQFPARS